MMDDVPPQDEVILALIGNGISPDDLIAQLRAEGFPMDNVIEALQRAIERERITLDSEGTVVLVGQLAEAA